MRGFGAGQGRGFGFLGGGGFAGEVLRGLPGVGGLNPQLDSRISSSAHPSHPNSPMYSTTVKCPQVLKFLFFMLSIKKEGEVEDNFASFPCSPQNFPGSYVEDFLKWVL